MVAQDFGMINKELGEEEVAALDHTMGKEEKISDPSHTYSSTPSVTTASTAEAEPPKKPEKPAMEELDELIGLSSIKKDVKELVDLVKTQTLREKEGLKAVPVSLHLVFSGNPGTGKTTVARILARLYKEIGALPGGQLVECDRSSLVAGFIGQTAIKTQEKIQEAMGGILFIDEAYTLAKEGQDYGQEAIDTILKAMEDHRGEFVVIVAGYTELMKKFVESNPGLKSRFNKYIEFPDYTREELWEIFALQCKKYEYVLTEEAERLVKERIGQLEKEKGENFANAREIRNLFERIITLQATRIAREEKPDAAALKTLEAEDVLRTMEGHPQGAEEAAPEEPLKLSEEREEEAAEKEIEELLKEEIEEAAESKEEA
ncbi:MAG: AAA family ATPase [Blautia sp.]|nr:AAA family ATPase [Blautia sp.]